MLQFLFCAFQFLYGSIKSEQHELNKPACSKFQFLYGSIKSPLTPASLSSPTKFQFLYGSIKSVEEVPLFSPNSHFNSSMVRLKVQNFIEKIIVT